VPLLVAFQNAGVDVASVADREFERFGPQVRSLDLLHDGGFFGRHDDGFPFDLGTEYPVLSTQYWVPGTQDPVVSFSSKSPRTERVRTRLASSRQSAIFR